MRRFLLLLWAICFASAVRVPVRDGVFGELTFALAVWMGFYPLAMASGIAAARYWRMLAVFVGIGMLLGTVVLPAPLPGIVVGAILGLSLSGMAWNWWQQRRRKSMTR